MGIDALASRAKGPRAIKFASTHALARSTVRFDSSLAKWPYRRSVPEDGGQAQRDTAAKNDYTRRTDSTSTVPVVLYVDPVAIGSCAVGLYPTGREFNIQGCVHPCCEVTERSFRFAARLPGPPERGSCHETWSRSTIRRPAARVDFAVSMTVIEQGSIRARPHRSWPNT